MVKPEMIPEEVLRALCASMGCEWAMLDREEQIIGRRHIAAALAAWPEVAFHQQDINTPVSYLVLPLTTGKPVALAINDPRFLATIDREGDHEIGAGNPAIILPLQEPRT